jgi:hypothetical protein
MGFFRRSPPAPPATPWAPASPSRELFAESIGVTLFSALDPYITSVVNGHCTEAYKLGEERLLSFEVLLRNTSRTERVTVGGGKFHLFDDAHFMHESVTIDSRIKQPSIIEGFLLPGGSVRGWVTFVLPWQRQAARVQFFTGHLSGAVVAFDLPLVDAATLKKLHADYLEQRASGPPVEALRERERAVLALEAQASAALARVEYEEKARELEARAERARRTIEQATRLSGRPEPAPAPKGPPASAEGPKPRPGEAQPPRTAPGVFSDEAPDDEG